MVLSPRAQGIADGTWHKQPTKAVIPSKTITKPEEPKCNVCGDSPKDCKCEDCDCDKV